MYLSAPGLVCSVGLTADAACAAMRAGVAAFSELPYLDNRREPIVGAAVPGLDPGLSRSERLVALLSGALQDTLGQFAEVPLEQVPLIVGLAEPDRPAGSAAAQGIIPAVEEELAVRFHPQLSETIGEGHTSGFAALALAGHLLENAAVPACLVCGVDSYLNASVLNWLDGNWRLKTEENSDGVIPGEAAGSFLVTREQRDGTAGRTRLLGLGFGTEAAPVLSEEPLLGLGLTEACRTALAAAGVEMHEIGFRVSDVTGESYGFREQALAVARLLRVHREEGLPIWHCAEYIGDTGAASGVIEAVMVMSALGSGSAPGEIALCCASALSGRRAAALLAAQRSPEL